MSFALATVSTASNWPACPAESATGAELVDPVTPPTLCHENVPTAMIDEVPVLETLQKIPSLKPFDNTLKPPFTARHPTFLKPMLAGGMYVAPVLLLGIVTAFPLSRTTICEVTLTDDGYSDGVAVGVVAGSLTLKLMFSNEEPLALGLTLAPPMMTTAYLTRPTDGKFSERATSTLLVAGSKRVPVSDAPVEVKTSGLEL